VARLSWTFGGNPCSIGVSKRPHHAHARARELARRRQGKRNNAAFRGAVGRLPDLTFISRNRSGRDNDAALAVGERVESGHVRRGDPQEVEAADQIDLDDAPERVQRQRTVAPDDPTWGADAGAIDGDSRRAVPLARRRNGGFHRGGVGHIAADR
jgi:hypothetical protein